MASIERTTYQALIKRLTDLGKKLEQPHRRVVTALPYLVVRVQGIEDPFTDPSVVWRSVLAGESEMTDWPGYEAHNEEHARMALRMRVEPKLYLFDPEDGIEP